MLKDWALLTEDIRPGIVLGGGGGGLVTGRPPPPLPWIEGAMEGLLLAEGGGGGWAFLDSEADGLALGVNDGVELWGKKTNG